VTAPSVQYLVAWANNPRDDITGFTVATNQTPTAGKWTDISAKVLRGQWGRGRADELSSFSPGRAVVTVDNNDGRFSPWNTASPYAGFLRPMRWMQIRVNGATRWTGHITTLPEQWPDRRSRYVDIVGLDQTALCGNKNLVASQYATTVIADGATTYYRLGDSSPSTGSSVVDSIAGLNGNFQGAVTPLQAGAIAGDADTCCQFGPYQFNSSTGGSGTPGYVKIPEAMAPVATYAFSVEFWYKVDANFNAGGGTQSTVTLFNVAVAPGASGGAVTSTLRSTGQVNTTILDGGGHLLQVLGNKVITDGNWHHIVIVLASTRTSFTQYIDGVADVTSSTGTAIDFATNTTPTFSYISSPPEFLAQDTGYWDEFAFYKGVALTGAQVADHYTKGIVVFAAQLSGARIGTVLDIVGWPAALRDIDTGVTTVQAQTSSLATTKALAHMQAVEITEAGALFAGADGKIVFVDRNALSAIAWAAPVATFGDNPGELPFEEGPQPTLDVVNLYTEATVQRDGGVTQYWSDAASSALYGQRTRALSGLLLTDDASSLYRAQFEVDLYHQPLERLAQITLDVNAAPTMLTTMIGLDLLELVQINRHDITGDAFAQTAAIEGITERHEDVRYSMDLTVSPVQVQRYWVLGTSALDSTTRLGL